MSTERAVSGAVPSVPAFVGGLGLLVISILNLAILLGWRDRGSATD